MRCRYHGGNVCVAQVVSVCVLGQKVLGIVFACVCKVQTNPWVSAMVKLNAVHYQKDTAHTEA